MELVWASGGRQFTTELPMPEIRKASFDGRSLAETAAGFLAKDLLKDVNASGSLRLEIVEPDAFAGDFDVAYSYNDKTGKIGTNARSLFAATSERQESHWDAVARMTHPADVMTAYTLLGNIYGHSIECPAVPGRWSDEDVNAIRRAYDNADFHGCGYPVYCKTSGRVGLLATEPKSDFDIDPFSSRAREFYRNTGTSIQTAEWEEGNELTVCFIPVENGDAKSAVHVLHALHALRPAPVLKP